MNKLKHIFTMVLLAIAVFATAQENYVIDSVCVDATRDYRIKGEKGSVYAWYIKDLSGVEIANPAYTDFSETDASGDSIWGSEINFMWTEPGEFEISTMQISIHGCDTVVQGHVKVFDKPGAIAGDDLVVCAGDNVVLRNDSAWNYSNILWATLGDGTFDFDDRLHPTYTPGENDLLAGAVTLYLTANGLAENGSCIPATDSVSIFLSKPVILFTTYDLLCFGDGSGSIKVSASGGVGPYSFNWKGPDGYTANNTDSIYGLNAGFYFATVTDNNGCVSIDSVEIVEPAPLIASIDSTNQITCFGDNDGALRVAVAGGTKDYSYSWDTTPEQTTALATGLTAGIYTVTVTDENACRTTASGEIIEPERIITAIDSIHQLICFGDRDGAARVRVTNGIGNISYSWSTVPEQTTALATGLASGWYFVTVTDENGCTVTDSVEIIAPDPMLASIDSLHQITCFGYNDGAARVSVSGGTGTLSYVWNSVPEQTTALATGLAAGEYIVTITDENGCTTSDSVEIVEPPQLVASIDSTHQISCFGANDGAARVAVSGGTGTMTYLWNSLPEQTTALATGLPAGLYIVTVTDENGCIALDSVEISEPAQLIAGIDSTHQIRCFGDNDGAMRVAATGGTGDYAYSWNSTPEQTTALATGLVAGWYTVTVTDENGCVAIDSAEIIEPDPILTSIDSIHQITCFGDTDGAARVAVSGGTGALVYSWNTVPEQTTALATGLSAGLYIVTVTDENGCTVEDSVEIIAPPELIASIDSIHQITCFGESDGAVRVNAFGGTGVLSYSWDSTPEQTTALATGLAPGKYIVTVTDENGCFASDSVEIIEPEILIAAIDSTHHITCFGDNDGATRVAVTGGTEDYFYSWNTLPEQTTALATGLAAGVYTVRVTDQNGCVVMDSVEIIEPERILTVIDSTHQLICFGDSDGAARVSVLNGVGVISYSWNSVPEQTTALATGLTAGFYIVTVTDEKGCSAQDTVEIVEPEKLLTSIDSLHPITCFGDTDGAARVNVVGGKGTFTYSWNSTPEQTTALAVGLAAGKYIVTVTDENGCSVEDSVEIVEPAQMISQIDRLRDITCYGEKDGLARVSVTGGTGELSYSWNTLPEQTTALVTDLAAGQYIVTVTDENGCFVLDTVEIVEPPQLIATIDSTHQLFCYGDSDGAARVNASGGTGELSYSWNSIPEQTNAVATGLSAGIYTVTVTDRNGCFVKDTVEIIEPEKLIVSIDSTYQLLCFGDTNGAARVKVVNGSGTYFYSWSTVPEQTNALAVGLAAGKYIVTVIDENGCSIKDSVEIIEPEPILTAIDSTHQITCFGDTDGAARVSVLNATGTYSYLWNTVPEQTTALATGLAAGLYYVTVTDKNGCSTIDSVEIVEPEEIFSLVSIASDNNEVCEGETITFTAAPTNGGTLPIYTWLVNGIEVSGETAETYSYIPQNGDTVMARMVSNMACVLNNPVTSNKIGIKVDEPLPVSISIIASATEVDLGESVSFAAAPENGGTNPIYTWIVNGIEIPGETAETFTYIPLNGDTVQARLTSSLECVTNNPAVSNKIGIKVYSELNLALYPTMVGCFGDSNGAIELTASGGSGNYSYAWNTGQSTKDISNLSPGLYIVTVNDRDDGTVKKDTVEITQPPLIQVTETHVNVGTLEAPLWNVTLTVEGGTPLYKYAWNNFENTKDLSGVPSGEYTVAVKDANGCDTTLTITLEETSIGVVAKVTNVQCFGDNNGSIELTLLGGVGTVNYAWEDGATGASRYNLSPGSYKVIVSDEINPSIDTTFTITEPNELSVSYTKIDVGFSTEPIGAITLNVMGGTSPYRYFWTGPDGFTSNQKNLTNLPKGVYTVKILDENNCETSETIIIQASDINAMITCPPDTFLTCSIVEIAGIYADLDGFYKYGGKIDPVFEYLPGSYRVESKSDGNTCPETVIFTHYLSDVNGAEVFCEQIIVVIDKIRPELVLGRKRLQCPDEIPPIYTNRAMFEAGKGNSASDNCELDWTTFKLDNEIDDHASCPQTIVRTYAIEDLCGNRRTAQEIIIIHDERNPQLMNPPKEIIADCVFPAPYTNMSEFNKGGGFVMDNCGPISMQYMGESNRVTAGEITTFNRTYRFTDACDNYIDVVQKVTVTGIVAPMFDPISPLCQFSEAPVLPTTSINGITGTWNPASVSTLVADTLEFVFTPDDGQCASPFTLEIVVTTEVVLTASIVPVGTSPNPIGSIDLSVDGGTSKIEYVWTGPDGFSETQQDISGLFAGKYFVTATDAMGCWDTLTVVVTSEESILEMECPPALALSCHSELSANSPFSTFAEYISAGGKVTSTCAINEASFTYLSSDTVAGAFCLNIERSYTIENSCGLKDTCTQLIYVDDTELPGITCPPDSSAECLSDLDFDIKAINDFIAAGGVIFDNCGIDSTSFSFNTKRKTVAAGIEISTTYSIKDLCGNENTCEHKVILSDLVPPVAACTDITVYLDNNGKYTLSDADKATITAGATDNCTAPENLIIEVSISEFDCEDTESGKTVTVTVTDEAGNSDDCTATITVLDTLPPEAVCQPLTVYLDEYGKGKITAAEVDNGSSDNCEIDTIYLSRYEFDCADVGLNEVTLTVVDNYGNRDSCTATITVSDTIKPIVNCVEPFALQLDLDATYKLTVEQLHLSSSDACGIDSVYLSLYDLDCDNIGLTPVTVYARDVNGNIGECETQLTIFGNIPPTVLNDSAITVENIPVRVDVAANDYDGIKTDIRVETITLSKNAQNGSVELVMVNGNYNGVVIYTPKPGYVGTDVFEYKIWDDGIPCEPMAGTGLVFITVRGVNIAPVAVDDDFMVMCHPISGNVLSNDSDPDGDKINADQKLVKLPLYGEVVLEANGSFTYTPDPGFSGIDSFAYQICDNGLPSMCDTAMVYLTKVPDNDCDGIPDDIDIDDDNDGILDVDEGDMLVDSDLDGIPDSIDIDSDDDGIPDNIEAQAEGFYRPPLGIDANRNGWDAAYDPEEGGTPIQLADTDGDGIPDYLDIDSDNDGVFDFIEGHDLNADGIPDVTRVFTDSDRDGLDDIYDTVNGWNDPYSVHNAIGSNAPLQDFDGDGIRDWRDPNDEDDEYMTRDEDANNDGDFSNDDMDLDGYPDYLDKSLDCELFIPEGFSPNDDGVHDFFQILCIQNYPNARLMIFNRNGNKLFDKRHYGNLDVWGSDADAWWWGKSEHKLTLGQSGRLPSGNYVYVLELGNGKVKNGTVMIAY